MNLKICPKCNRIINVDNLEDGDPNSVIGCGLKEDDFLSCNECNHKYDSMDCKEIQNRLTKITVKEYYEVKTCI